MEKVNKIAAVTAFLSPSSFYEIYLINGFEKKNMELGGKYVINQHSTAGNVDRKKQFIQDVLAGHTADGIISMFLRFDGEDLAALKTNNIPVVFIDEEVDGYNSVKSDSFKGAYIATEYLIKKDRKKIGLVVGQMQTEGVGITPLERLNGYKRAIEDYGLKYDEKFVYEVMDYSFEDGERALAEFTKRGLGIDGVFSAAGDMCALGVMDEADRQGIEVPAKLSVIGYDDISMASLSRPKLTTIKQPIEEMGKEAFRILVDEIEGKGSKPGQIVFDPILVERNSC